MIIQVGSDCRRHLNPHHSLFPYMSPDNILFFGLSLDLVDIKTEGDRKVVYPNAAQEQDHMRVKIQPPVAKK